MEPDIVTREAALLDELERRAIPAPKHVAHDPCGPLLMTFEPGRTVHLPKDSTTFTRRLVDALVHIHAGGPPSSPGHRDQEARLDAHVQEESPRRNGVDVDPELWSHIRRLWPSIERRPPTLIHDDYHPGNVLWHRGRISAIVDWTVPGIGQAAADACYLRLDVSLVRGSGGRRRGAGRLRGRDGRAGAGPTVLGAPLRHPSRRHRRRLVRLVGRLRRPGLSLPLVEERLAAFVHAPSRSSEAGCPDRRLPRSRDGPTSGARESDGRPGQPLGLGEMTSCWISRCTRRCQARSLRRARTLAAESR